MSLQASTYIEGDSRRMRRWLNEALEEVLTDFPEVENYHIDLIDNEELSVTLKLSTTSFGKADSVTERIIERLKGIGANQPEGSFLTGQTELMPA